MFERSYLRKAGQLWKFYLGMTAVAVGGILIWAGRSQLEAFGERAGDVMLAGTALGVAGMVWSGVAIKCPKCGARLFWHAMSKQSPGSWLTWLFELEACPSCGTRAAPGPPNDEMQQTSQG